MRRAARVDDNHREIISTLREIPGVSVFDTSALPKFVDAVIARNGVNHLIEIKDGGKSPSRRKLTKSQRELHDTWLGTIHVVESVDDALRVVGVL